MYTASQDKWDENKTHERYYCNQSVDSNTSATKLTLEVFLEVLDIYSYAEAE